MKISKAKVMKAKTVSKIAKGPRARASVLAGRKEKTASGLTQSMLIKNARGKIVSKKASAAGRKKFKTIASWTKAIQQARKSLDMHGFVAVNGKTPQGKALYAKAKAIYSV